MATFRTLAKLAARNTLKRDRFATALILILVMLPVAGVATFAVGFSSATATLDQQLHNTLGGTEARIDTVSYPDPSLVQSPTDISYYNQDYDLNTGNLKSADVEAGYQDPVKWLPAGTDVVRLVTTNVLLTTDDRTLSLSGVAGPVSEPKLAGPLILLSGVRPGAAAEIALTPLAASTLGVRLGDTVTINDADGSTRSVKVVGLMQRATDRKTATVAFGSIAALGVDVTAASPPSTTTYVLTDSLSWADVRGLNAQGLVVYSRSVVTNPPPDSEVDARFLQDHSNPYALASALLVVLAIFLIIAVIIAAVFTMSIKRSQRHYAMLALVGMDRGQLFRLVSLQGILIGFIGAAIGALAGIGLAQLAIQVLGDGSKTQFPGFNVPWASLAGLILLAVLVGWIASIVPALVAGRVKVVEALRGAGRPKKLSKIMPIIGAALLGLGLVLTGVGAGLVFSATAKTPEGQISFDQGIFLTGTMVALAATACFVAGVIFGTPLILAGLSRVLGLFGASPRLAARDVARNRARSISTIAIILLVNLVSSFVVSQIASSLLIPPSAQPALSGQLSLDAQSIVYATNPPSSNYYGNVALVPSDAAIAKAVGAIQVAIPRADVRAVFGVLDPGVNFDGLNLTQSLKSAVISPVVAQNCPADLIQYSQAWYANENCTQSAIGAGQGISTILVGDISDLNVISGVEQGSEVRSALAAGKPVALHSSLLSSDGKLTIESWNAGRIATFDPAQPYGNSLSETLGDPDSTQSWPTVLAPTRASLWSSIFITRQAAVDLGWQVVPTRIIATAPGGITDAEAAMAASSLSRTFAATTDVQSRAILSPDVIGDPLASNRLFMWNIVGAAAVLSLIVSVVSLTLARFLARRDNQILWAVGAKPNTRRKMAFWQATLLAFLPSILGTLIGLMPAYVIGNNPYNPPFTIAWLPLSIGMVAVPLVVMLVTTLFTRSRIKWQRIAV